EKDIRDKKMEGVIYDLIKPFIEFCRGEVVKIISTPNDKTLGQNLDQLINKQMSQIVTNAIETIKKQNIAKMYGLENWDMAKIIWNRLNSSYDNNKKVVNFKFPNRQIFTYILP